jgi:carbon monoxide dehydrogenase subunit G
MLQQVALGMKRRVLFGTPGLPIGHRAEPAPAVRLDRGGDFFAGLRHRAQLRILRGATMPADQESTPSVQHTRDSAAADSPTAVLLHLDGQELFAQSRENLWKHLTDLAFLPRCMPDLERVVASDAGRLVVRVRPGFSFVRGTLEITIELIDSHSPDSVRMRVRSKGVGSGVNLEMRFALSDADATAVGQTCVAWAADVLELSGLLKPVSRSLIAAGARKVISDACSRLRTEIEVVPDNS